MTDITEVTYADLHRWLSSTEGAYHYHRSVKAVFGKSNFYVRDLRSDGTLVLEFEQPKPKAKKPVLSDFQKRLCETVIQVTERNSARKLTTEEVRRVLKDNTTYDREAIDATFPDKEGLRTTSRSRWTW